MTEPRHESRSFCFAPPVAPAGLMAQRVRVPRLRVAEEALTSNKGLQGLNDATAMALAGVLPSLLCGEESAVHVFNNEGNRVSVALHDSASSALFQIAAEEGLEERVRSALDSVLVASVGPATSEALRDNRIHVDFEPSHPKMGFLVQEAAALATNGAKGG